MLQFKRGELLGDKYVQKVSERLKKFIDKNKEDVYYYRELVVYFEKVKFNKKTFKFYHWVTGHAIYKLLDEGYLKECREQFEYGEVVFLRHKSFRYYKKRIKKKIGIINRYSNPDVCRTYGEYADKLFQLALLKKDFKFISEDFNELKGKKWKATNHNLDFAIEKDRIIYGVEVKNTLDYIDRDELDIKIKMCNHLGIRPLFIMRNAPSPYINEIIEANGFALIFDKQIYPSPYKELVNDIHNETLFRDRVMVSNEIPDGIIKRFVNWHNKYL